MKKVPMAYLAREVDISFDHVKAGSIIDGTVFPNETWAVCLDGDVYGSIEKSKHGWELVILCEIGRFVPNKFGPEFTLEQVQEEWLSLFAPYLPIK